jgi:hypothetical protein
MCDFDTPPRPNEIASEKTLTRNARRVLALYEDRANINRLGDTKLFDTAISELLNISLKTVYNCKQRLIRGNFISIHHSRVLNRKDQFRTVQTVRCWRSIYGMKFKIEKKNTWKTKMHPDLDIQLCKRIVPAHLIGKPTVYLQDYDTPAVVDFTRIGDFLKPDRIDEDREWECRFELASRYPNLWTAELENRLGENLELLEMSVNGEDYRTKIRLGLDEEVRLSKDQWYQEMVDYRDRV